MQLWAPGFVSELRLLAALLFGDRVLILPRKLGLVISTIRSHGDRSTRHRERGPGELNVSKCLEGPALRSRMKAGRGEIDRNF